MIFTLNTTHGKSRKVAGIRLTPEPRLFCLGRAPAGTDAVSLTQEQLAEIRRAIDTGASVRMVSLERDEKRAELRQEVARLEGELHHAQQRIAELEQLLAERDQEIAEQRDLLIHAEQQPRPEHALQRIAVLEQLLAARDDELATRDAACAELEQRATAHDAELAKLRAELAQERARRKK
jgi:septal ring factor EnvC (AmiA/AmiB activator)